MRGTRDYYVGQKFYENKKYIAGILLIAVLFLSACGGGDTAYEKQKANKVEKEIEPVFKEIAVLCEKNSLKVLQAFRKEQVSDMHFNSTTGYGYDDIGRDTIEKIFADVLKAEDALVRSQFISGTHALTVALFAYLRPGDCMLSICGKPYGKRRI